jgi:hypothetical protein
MILNVIYLIYLRCSLQTVHRLNIHQQLWEYNVEGKLRLEVPDERGTLATIAAVNRPGGPLRKCPVPNQKRNLGGRDAGRGGGCGTDAREGEASLPVLNLRLNDISSPQSQYND